MFGSIYSVCRLFSLVLWVQTLNAVKLKLIWLSKDSQRSGLGLKQLPLFFSFHSPWTTSKYSFLVNKLAASRQSHVCLAMIGKWNGTGDKQRVKFAWSLSFIPVFNLNPRCVLFSSAYRHSAHHTDLSIQAKGLPEWWTALFPSSSQAAKQNFPAHTTFIMVLFQAPPVRHHQQWPPYTTSDIFNVRQFHQSLKAEAPFSHNQLPLFQTWTICSDVHEIRLCGRRESTIKTTESPSETQ